MPEIRQVNPKPAKKRRIDEDVEETADDDIIDVTPAKRTRLDSHSVPKFINNIFKKVSDWFKRTSQNNTHLFGVSKESNSAAAAIAHGGQYLEEASTDKFMPHQNLNRNGEHPFMNQGYKLSQQQQTTSAVNPKAGVLSDLGHGSQHQQASLAQGVMVNGDRFYGKINTNGSSRNYCHHQTHSEQNNLSQSKADNLSVPTGGCTLANPGSSLYSFTPSVKTGKGRHTSGNSSYKPNSSINYNHFEMDSNLDNSQNTEQLNGKLQKSYVDHSARAKSPSRRSTTFESTFNECSSGPQCFDLDEKERYKRLLQQFSVPVSDKSITQDRRSIALSRLSTRPTTSTVIDQSSIFFSHEKSPSSSSTMITAPITHHPAGADVSGISASLNRSTDRQRHLSTAVRKIAATQNYTAKVQPSSISKRCDTLVRRMQEIQERSKNRLGEQERLQAEEMKLAEWEKLRVSEDEHLQRMVEQRLKLSAKVILEDLPPPDEPEYDEFPELDDEAQLAVSKALQRGPNNILSEAFRIKISRNDIATLSNLNWLNDEVVNFYFNLIQDRSGKDGLPPVYVFNTFYYPKIMKDGHKGVRRWTKAVDIFSKDLILVPIHLGMHWCLACINMRDKIIQYFDSMGGGNNACLMALKQYLEDESMDKKKQPFDTSDWTLECVTDIPQQMNGSDCGVFSCKYAEYLSRDAPFTFSQEDMPYFRHRMIYEILTKKLM